MTFTRPHLLFDLDGTLSDPLDGIARSINYALDAFGYPTFSPGELARFIGPPLDQTFRELCPGTGDAHVRELVEKFREYFGHKGYAENALYPGIPEMLASLHARGVPLALCTAKRADFADKIIRLFCLDPYIDFISGGDIGIRKGMQIRDLLAQGRITADAVMIGDREGDILAARENGIRSAGVLWGYGSREELAAAGPDWMVEAPGDLAGLVDRL